LRRAGAVQRRAAWHSGRPHERRWRVDLDRPPLRHERCAHDGARLDRGQAPRRSPRRRHHVRRRRHGRGRAVRGPLTGMSSHHPIRWSWALFGTLLVLGYFSFLWTTDWRAQTWLDLSAIAVSPIAAAGVLLYAFTIASPAPAFWRWFRWLFIGVAA